MFLLSLACIALSAQTSPPAPQAKRVEQPARFDHARAEHRKSACSVCHVRDAGKPADPSSRLPYHDVCITCHGAENYLKATAAAPFCAGCHPLGDILDSNSQPRLTAFPDRLRQFSLAPFSHASHAKKECLGCHTFNAAMNEVTVGSHAQCYSCHEHQAGQKKGRCDDCHLAATPPVTPRVIRGAPTERFQFSHRTHRTRRDGSAIACNACHVVPQGKPHTGDLPPYLTPAGLRHTSSCWGQCHLRELEPRCLKCHAGGVPL